LDVAQLGPCLVFYIVYLMVEFGTRYFKRDFKEIRIE